MKAIYISYGSISENECETFEEANDFLNELEDYGDGYAICIYDEENRIAYFIENMEIIGKSKNDVFNQKIDILKKIGLEPLKIDFYK